MNSNLLLCPCGKSFIASGPLKNHQKSCNKAKSRLLEALEKAKESWRPKKRRRLEDLEASNLALATGPADIVEDINIPADIVDAVHVNNHMDVPVEMDHDLHLSLAERRVRREIRMPQRFIDILPQPLPLLPPAEIISEPTAPPSASNSHLRTQPSNLQCLRTFQTPRNIFGLFRQFRSERLPSHDPEELVNLQELSDQPEISERPQPNILEPPVTAGSASMQTQHKSGNPFHPYPNKNSFLLGDWYWNHGVRGSQESFHELLNIVGNPEFHPDDIQYTKWRQIDKTLGSNPFDEEEDGEHMWIDEDIGWKRTPINISVPFHSKTKRPGPQNYHVGHLYHRSLVSIVREKLGNPQEDAHFHYEPFKLFWRPADAEIDVQVHGELYTSPAFLDAHRELQESPREPRCNLPRVVVAMMFWSDETHLTSFGTAKLWPCYLYFGNESKYRRCKPTCHLCNHVAYFKQLPDAFKDFATDNTNGKGQSSALMKHCRREVLHAQWDLLLDEEFIEAYEHGIVVQCCDGVERRFYLRIFTYSADYKEKVILATIRQLGNYPCPRCLIPMTRVQDMGTKRDMRQRKTLAQVDDQARRRKIESARNIIYKKNYAVDSNPVEALLKDQSLVPTFNAFSQKLARFGFNLFNIFVVDFMHEIELGVWKELFLHLLRILHAAGGDSALGELDRRFRQVPTFGADTIRRFMANVSELKKLTAGDFEDLLQCIIPVFEGLLPEPHNSSILRLLFICAHWHGLAKLRMHTDHTLKILEETTTSIGTAFRKFTDKTCPAFNTRELKREEAAHDRRSQKAAVHALGSSGSTLDNISRSTTDQPGSVSRSTLQNATSSSITPDESDTDPNQSGLTPHDASSSMARQSVSGSTATTKTTGRKPKQFSLRRYKYHALGDYVSTIRRYGTTDSYSTEPGELEHRTPKARYKRTDKKKFIRQLARIERREARLRRVHARLSGNGGLEEQVAKTPQEHHHIGVSQNHHEHIGTFLRRNAGDPAIKDFLPKLKQHLLTRITHIQPDQLAMCSPDSILLKHDRMYTHNIMRINYTTYDLRRSRDVVNPSTSHCNIMVLADGDNDQSSTHPFHYGRVLGVYHVNVVYVGPGMIDYQPRRMEVLWVQWYEGEATRSLNAGWKTCKLDRIHFSPMADRDSFGFIDPSDVLRSCHVVPSFVKGKLHADGQGLSFCAGDSSDWAAYYVNRFVDRDMLLRYHFGLGVGHLYARDKAGGITPDSNSQQHSDDEPDLSDTGEAIGAEPGPSYENEYAKPELEPQEEFDGDLSSNDDDDSLDIGSDDEGCERDVVDDEELYAFEKMYRT